MNMSTSALNPLSTETLNIIELTTNKYKLPSYIITEVNSFYCIISDRIFWVSTSCIEGWIKKTE